MKHKDDQDEGSGLKIQDLLKTVVFMTEDSVKSFLKDKKIPKEWATELMNMAGKRKGEILDVVAREFSQFLQRMDLQKEMSDFLKKHKINIEVSVQPKKDEEEKQ